MTAPFSDVAAIRMAAPLLRRDTAEQEASPSIR